MNKDYYQEVLEDVQKDLSEVEQTVSELQGLERYVQRKMEADDNGGSKLTYDQYQSLLEDVRNDVDGARSKIGELRGVGNFAREKLKAAGVEVEEFSAAPPIVQTVPATAARANIPAEDTPAAKIAKANGPKPAPKNPPPKNEPPSLSNTDSSQTVEFGPDGFPMK